MAKIVWTGPALNDLHHIITFIAQDSPKYAERVGVRIVQAPRHLTTFPYSGRIVPEFNDSSIREFIYGSYRIIYAIRSTAYYIVAVLHSSRDLLGHVSSEDWDIT